MLRKNGDSIVLLVTSVGKKIGLIYGTTYIMKTEQSTQTSVLMVIWKYLIRRKCWIIL